MHYKNKTPSRINNTRNYNAYFDNNNNNIYYNNNYINDNNNNVPEIKIKALNDEPNKEYEERFSLDNIKKIKIIFYSNI